MCVQSSLSARIQYLEAQLRTSQQEAASIEDELNEEISVVKRKSRDRLEKETQDLGEKVLVLTTEMEKLKAEVNT